MHTADWNHFFSFCNFERLLRMRRLYCKGGCIINLGSVAAVELMSANCACELALH